MTESNNSREPYARITIDVYDPHQRQDEGGLIYQQRRQLPPVWFTDTRYHGYVSAEFQEMYEDLVTTMNGQP